MERNSEMSNPREEQRASRPSSTRTAPFIKGNRKDKSSDTRTLMEKKALHREFHRALKTGRARANC